MYVIHQETGFWFIFHHVPTGPSEGLYSPGHTEHVPMGLFTNNRAHSNYRVSVKMAGCQKLEYQIVYYFSSFDHINKLTVFVIILFINNYRNHKCTISQLHIVVLHARYPNTEEQNLMLMFQLTIAQQGYNDLSDIHKMNKRMT